MLCIVLKILLYKLVKKQAFRDWKMSITKMHCVKILLKVQRRRTSIPTQNNTVNADTFRVQCNPSLDLRLSMRVFFGNICKKSGFCYRKIEHHLEPLLFICNFYMDGSTWMEGYERLSKGR